MSTSQAINFSCKLCFRHSFDPYKSYFELYVFGKKVNLTKLPKAHGKGSKNVQKIQDL
jgi:hypothetical protein